MQPESLSPGEVRLQPPLAAQTEKVGFGTNSYCIAYVMRHALHLRYRMLGGTMSRRKDETLSIRTSSEVKELLRLAAQKEHRSVASMIEVLVLNYARKNNLRSAEIPDGNEAKTE